MGRGAVRPVIEAHKTVFNPELPYEFSARYSFESSSDWLQGTGASTNCVWAPSLTSRLASRCGMCQVTGCSCIHSLPSNEACMLGPFPSSSTLRSYPRALPLRSTRDVLTSIGVHSFIASFVPHYCYRSASAMGLLFFTGSARPGTRGSRCGQNHFGDPAAEVFHPLPIDSSTVGWASGCETMC